MSMLVSRQLLIKVCLVNKFINNPKLYHTSSTKIPDKTKIPNRIKIPDKIKIPVPTDKNKLPVKRLYIPPFSYINNAKSTPDSFTSDFENFIYNLTYERIMYYIPFMTIKGVVQDNNFYNNLKYRNRDPQVINQYRANITQCLQEGNYLCNYPSDVFFGSIVRSVIFYFIFPFEYFIFYVLWICWKMLINIDGISASFKYKNLVYYINNKNKKIKN